MIDKQSIADFRGKKIGKERKGGTIILKNLHQKDV